MIANPKVKVVLQARLGSHRLPAKILLPIFKETPLFVAVFERARNCGHHVVLATTVSSSDNVLASKAKSYGIPVIRGPVNDVLARYVLATSDLEPDDLCIRLTCDNVFPDGNFINALYSEWVEHQPMYMQSSQLLPYGMSCELIKVSALRKAAESAKENYDREHVTPWIKNNLETQFSMLSHDNINYSNIRCTIDTLEDYLMIASFFLENPLAYKLNAFGCSNAFIKWKQNRGDFFES
jgi:spore coat polysaccharide biosynthesis protein SpsF